MLTSIEGQINKYNIYLSDDNMACNVNHYILFLLFSYFIVFVDNLPKKMQNFSSKTPYVLQNISLEKNYTTILCTISMYLPIGNTY